VSDLVIDTRGLRKWFGPTLAVADLSLSVRAGEIFGFLGPNGAGKTTSIKMLLSLVHPDGGDGTVLGEPLGNRAARGRIGFLPEHFRFHDCLTARELLRFHGRLYGLSGSNLEMRIVAQALLNDPQLVFLDEPTSGLDPLGRLLVRDIIAELRDRGTTVFLNSHLLGEVEATCDRVAFVKQGRTIHEMVLGQSVDFIDLEIRVSPLDACLLEALSAFGSAISRSSADIVRMRVESEATIPALTRWLVERGTNVYGLQPRRKSLEEWFVEVMGEDQRPG
jgi:ABC-2 type transport system ATP-binding protein